MWVAVTASILAPFAGTLLVAGLSRLTSSPKAAGLVANLAAFGSFAAALGALAYGDPRAPSELKLWAWAVGPGFQLVPSLFVDGVTLLMLAVVSGVSALIHLYSVGYMEGDSGIWRYFATINFFLGSMLLLVSAGSLVVLMVGWAGVGLASYLLIAHWFERPEAASAGVKAFIVNAFGDAGLMLATVTAVALLGTDQYRPLLTGQAETLPSWALTAILLGMFVAAVAKSAQVPLQVWLPDAMAGPTPVSALIHAATMVTAGVYLLVRFQNIVAAVTWATPLIMAIGTATLLLGATAAIAQANVKRVLAYSTISQLGYMFLAAGALSPVAALFHLTGHAFFKALLFLSAGLVIHALGGEEDLRRMRGLTTYLPLAKWTFFVGALGLTGLPPAVGFFSKDEIIASAALQQPGMLWAALALLGTLATALYTFRAWAYLFFGGEQNPAGHVHRAGWTMTVPTVLLAGATLLGGLLQYPDRTLSKLLMAEESAPPAGLLLLGVLAAAFGAFLALLSFRRHSPEVYPTEHHGRLWALVASGWGFDMTYSSVVVKPALNVASALRTAGERALFLVTVGLGSWLALGISYLVRRWQSGYARPYLLAAFAGVVLLLISISVFSMR